MTRLLAVVLTSPRVRELAARGAVLVAAWKLYDVARDAARDELRAEFAAELSQLAAAEPAPVVVIEHQADDDAPAPSPIRETAA